MYSVRRLRVICASSRVYVGSWLLSACVPSPPNVHNDREQHTEKYDFQRKHVDHDSASVTNKNTRPVQH
jgi:hypothetical protein